jgi:adenylate cyclase
MGGTLKRTLGWGGAAGGLVVALLAAGLLETQALQALNLLFDLRGPRPPAAPIVIVTIDEDSFDELNQSWPWARALHGRLIDAIAAGRPIAIGFDVVFSEPSARGERDDRAFARAIDRAGNVVLAAARTVVDDPLFVKVDYNPPLPELRRGAAGFGIVNYDLDTDANVRRASLESRLDADTLHSFVWHLYQLAARAGVPAKPLPGVEGFIINYRGGARTYPHIPYHRVLDGSVGPQAFAGKIVLVGATTPVLHDVFTTPFAPANGMAGVEIHAHTLETLFQGNRIREAPRAAVGALALAAALLAAWVTLGLRPLRAFPVLAAGWLALGSAALGLFAFLNAWIDVVAPTLAAVLGYGVTVVVEFIQEQRERRRLARFFSPAVVKEIVRHKDDAHLGSSRRLLTVLFSDIRGFTSMSERLPPEQVAELLSDYLTELTEVVFRHGGTVDKYVGDCIMALYNVPFEQPDHAAQAVRTAIEFQERTRAISERWEARTGVQILNGVGINTGEAVVGTLGSRQRLEYTAIGDTVNLAARLESITKDFHSPIIVSESTYTLLDNKFPARALGEVAVKGKERPVRIYAVLTANSRKDDRVRADFGVRITLDDMTVHAFANDVSVSGLSVRGLALTPTKGRIVQVRLEGPGLLPSITADARVVWSGEDAAGLEFVELPPDAVATLSPFVAARARSHAAPGPAAVPAP